MFGPNCDISSRKMALVESDTKLQNLSIDGR